MVLAIDTLCTNITAMQSETEHTLSTSTCSKLSCEYHRSSQVGGRHQVCVAHPVDHYYVGRQHITDSRRAGSQGIYEMPIKRPSRVPSRSISVNF